MSDKNQDHTLSAKEEKAMTQLAAEQLASGGSDFTRAVDTAIASERMANLSQVVAAAVESIQDTETSEKD